MERAADHHYVIKVRDENDVFVTRSIVDALQFFAGGGRVGSGNGGADEDRDANLRHSKMLGDAARGKYNIEYAPRFVLQLLLLSLNGIAVTESHDLHGKALMDLYLINNHCRPLYGVRPRFPVAEPVLGRSQIAALSVDDCVQLLMFLDLYMCVVKHYDARFSRNNGILTLVCPHQVLYGIQYMYYRFESAVTVANTFGSLKTPPIVSVHDAACAFKDSFARMAKEAWGIDLGNRRGAILLPDDDASSRRLPGAVWHDTAVGYGTEQYQQLPIIEELSALQMRHPPAPNHGCSCHACRARALSRVGFPLQGRCVQAHQRPLHARQYEVPA